jgi:insulysin
MSTIDGLRKPDSDTRQYRVITLENKLCVVLVSDPETNSAAAALAVSAGQLQDPVEVQGLAHFLEHMLFLGNKKFPEASDFDGFCALSAGYSNAWTGMDRTVYHFVLAHENLREALDRFSGFFSCPLFTEELTDRELHAIDSENNKNLQEDGRREFQLLRSTAKDGHPLQRFGTGNYKTLHDMPQQSGTNIREHLLEFHNGCYSANIMKLAVLGRENLDTLEAWVRELFADVPNRDLQSLQGVSADDNPFDAQWKQIYRVIPVKERRKLVLYFPTPSTYPMYLTKPLRLLSHCIGHEGPGSILSYLKKKGWGTELSAGTGTQSQYFSLFEISIKLSEDGVPHYKEILSIVFGYINTIFRKSSHEEKHRIRREMSMMEDLNFRFRSKVREDQYTEQLACNLTRYPEEHVLCGPDLFFEPLDLASLEALMDQYFTPENLRVHLVAPLEEQPSLPSNSTWEEELWYTTKYIRSPFQASDFAFGTNPDPANLEGLHLPQPNPYIPTDCQLKTEPSASRVPQLIVDAPTVKGWHLFDASFGQPKGSVQIQLTNFIGERSPRHAVCLRMILEVLQDITNEEAYEAEEAGLIFDISNSSNTSPCTGLRLSFKGYDDKMPALVKRILSILVSLNLKDHQAVFDLMKETVITDYRNRRFQQNYMHAIIASNRLLEHPFYSNEERCAALETLTSEEVQQFHAEFVSQLLVEAILVGNFTTSEAKTLINEAFGVLNCTELSPDKKPVLRITKLPQNQPLLHEQLGPDPEAVDSAISVYMQCGPRSVKSDVLLELLCQVMDKAMFQQLRTTEQLGYIVNGGTQNKWGVNGLRCLIQSVHSPAFLETRLETFLESFETKLQELSDEDFAEHVNSLRTKKLEKDRSVDKLCDRLMIEICNHENIFDRKEQEGEALTQLLKSDLVDFFQKFVSVKSSSRCSLFISALAIQNFR